MTGPFYYVTFSLSWVLHICPLPTFSLSWVLGICPLLTYSLSWVLDVCIPTYSLSWVLDVCSILTYSLSWGLGVFPLPFYSLSWVLDACPCQFVQRVGLKVLVNLKFVKLYFYNCVCSLYMYSTIYYTTKIKHCYVEIDITFGFVGNFMTMTQCW